MARPCKICKLKKSHPKAYKELTKQIKKNEKRTMNKFIESFNKKHGLDIIGMNVSRHKTHMEGNVHEIKEGDLSKSNQNQPQKSSAFLSNASNTLSFPNLDPKYEKFLLRYRANGYMDKEKMFKKSGFKDKKHVHTVMKRPEVQAALYEMRAIDFINLRITGNQIIANIGKIAHYPEYIDQMYDDDGRPITNIKLWPEELRCALSAVEMSEDVLIVGEDREEILKRKFKFKFESHLAAKKELRKHFMEIDLYRSGQEKMIIHEKTIAILDKRKDNSLNLIETMKLFEREGLPFPESLKLEIKDFDWELEKRVKKAEEDAKQALTITSNA